MASITLFYRDDFHELLRRFLEIICPPDFCKKIDEICSCRIAKLGSLIVPWKDMMIIVRSFTGRNKVNPLILRRIYVPAKILKNEIKLFLGDTK